MPEGVHLFSVLGGNVSELLPYNKGGLDHVEIGLGLKEPQRAEEDDMYLDLTLCLLLSACFWGLEDEI